MDVTKHKAKAKHATSVEMQFFKAINLEGARKITKSCAVSIYRLLHAAVPILSYISLAAKVDTGSPEDISCTVEQITAFPSPNADNDKWMGRQQNLPSSCQHHSRLLSEQPMAQEGKDAPC